MPMPWRATVITVDGTEEPDDHEVGAYHLEDLVVEVQRLIGWSGMFRIELPVGPEPVSVTDWADMIAHNYVGGEPEEAYDGFITVTTRNGAVIVRH